MPIRRAMCRTLSQTGTLTKDIKLCEAGVPGLSPQSQAKETAYICKRAQRSFK